jgi:hypothetical protein
VHRLVSILVNNWNYAGYVGAAIDSALAQTHPQVEVIVVDDGSTDASREVIARYADRVRVIEQENAGQPAAGAAGLAAARGDIVMFLDADDLLFPGAAARVSSAWREGCSKVQFRLSLVGPDGRHTGAADPPLSAAMPQGDLVAHIDRFGRYETPVTSGNAYPRALVEQLFPIPGDFHNIDGYLNTVCPFYGPVISLEEELGAYRQHGDNRWAASSGMDAPLLRRKVHHDLIKERFAERTAAATGRVIAAGSAMRNPMHVLQRLGSLRLEPEEHPVPGDTVRGLLAAGLRALWTDTSLPWPDRVFYGGVLVAVALGPPPVAARAIDSALASRPRPAWMRRLARALRALRSPLPD